MRWGQARSLKPGTGGLKPEAKSPKPASPSPPRLSTGGGGWSLRVGRSRRLFLAFHLSEALLESGHEIDHRSQLLGLLYRRHFPALELGLDQLLQVFLEGVFIFFRVPVVGQ